MCRYLCVSLIRVRICVYVCLYCTYVHVFVFASCRCACVLVRTQTAPVYTFVCVRTYIYVFICKQLHTPSLNLSLPLPCSSIHSRSLFLTPITHAHAPRKPAHGALLSQHYEPPPPAHLMVQPIQIDSNTTNARKAPQQRALRKLAPGAWQWKQSAELCEPFGAGHWACSAKHLPPRRRVPKPYDSIGTVHGHWNDHRLGARRCLPCSRQRDSRRWRRRRRQPAGSVGREMRCSASTTPCQRRDSATAAMTGMVVGAVEHDIECKVGVLKKHAADSLHRVGGGLIRQ